MKPLLTVMLLFSCCFLFSQNISVYSYTNTCGVYSVLASPANAAGSTDYLSINLTGAGIGVENNIIHTQLRYSMWQIATFKHRRDRKPHFGQPYYGQGREPAQPGFNLNSQVLLPAVKVNITPAFAVFVYARERVTGNAAEVGDDVLPMLTGKQTEYKLTKAQHKTDLKLLGYRELAAGFAAILYNKREAVVKAGVTVKKISGHFAYIVNMQHFITGTAIDGVNVFSTYRVINSGIDSNLLNRPAGLLTGSSAAGSGFAIDAGLVYEHRPYRIKHRYTTNNPKGKNKNFRQRDMIKYDYRIGIALQDWGTINFNGKNASDKSYQSRSSFDLKKKQTAEEFRNEVTKNQQVVNQKQNITVYMPASLVLTADYRINRQWFLAVVYAQNLRSAKRAENFFAPTAINALVRKEMQNVTYGIPLRIVPRTRTVTVGWLTQAGPFFFGTDNIRTFFGLKLYNWSLYAGICYTLRYKKDPTIETFKNFGQF